MSEFKFIPKEYAGEKVENLKKFLMESKDGRAVSIIENKLTQMEIAFQLKRIADILNNIEFRLKK